MTEKNVRRRKASADPPSTMDHSFGNCVGGDENMQFDVDVPSMYEGNEHKRDSLPPALMRKILRRRSITSNTRGIVAGIPTKSYFCGILYGLLLGFCIVLALGSQYAIVQKQSRSAMVTAKISPPSSSLYLRQSDRSQSLNENPSDFVEGEYQFEGTSPTPQCVEYLSSSGEAFGYCDGLCQAIRDYVRSRRNQIQSQPKNSKASSYSTLHQFLACMGAKTVVQVGDAGSFGSLPQYVLKHYFDNLDEYHLVDPFHIDFITNNQILEVAGWHEHKNNTFDVRKAISKEWEHSLHQSLSVDGEFLDVGMHPGGCKLRIQRKSSLEAVKLFATASVDVVFINGDHLTYREAARSIAAWSRAVKEGGALIVNGFDFFDQYPGIGKAALEEVDRRGIELRSLDTSNVVIGGSNKCALLASSSIPNHMTIARSIVRTKAKKEDELNEVVELSMAERGTAHCMELPFMGTTRSCDDDTLCKAVSSIVRSRRNEIQSQPSRGEAWYYPTLLNYFACTESKIIVQIGAGFGAVAQYMLKHHFDNITEYHIVDPFLVGHKMTNDVRDAVQDAPVEEISQAWAASISQSLCVDGEYLHESMEPAGCKLRIHRMTSKDAAKLFKPGTVDAIFVDGHRTFKGVSDDLAAWRKTVKSHSGSIVVNDFDALDEHPGVLRAVIEYAEMHKVELRSIDATNVVLGGPRHCAVSTQKALPALLKKAKEVATNEKMEASDQLFISAEGTPPCIKHPTTCNELCQSVGHVVRSRRDEVQADTNHQAVHFPTLLNYYSCIDAKVIVEIGNPLGSHAQYMLKHRSGGIRQYHVVDPFVATQEEEIKKAAYQGASEDAISIAWADSVRKAIGVDGEYLDEFMEPAGCKLRVHRIEATEGAKLFGDHSVDAIYIGGIPTYEGVRDVVAAWSRVLKPNSGALIFNHFDAFDDYPGVARLALEEADRRAIQIRSIDKTHKVLGGLETCAHVTEIVEKEQMEKARSTLKVDDRPKRRNLQEDSGSRAVVATPEPASEVVPPSQRISNSDTMVQNADIIGTLRKPMIV